MNHRSILTALGFFSVDTRHLPKVGVLDVFWLFFVVYGTFPLFFLVYVTFVLHILGDLIWWMF